MDGYRPTYTDKGKGKGPAISPTLSPQSSTHANPTALSLSGPLHNIVCMPMLQTQEERLFRERLILDGTEVIRLSVLQMLCQTFPMGYAKILLDKRDAFCSSKQLAMWAKMYNLTGTADSIPASSPSGGDRELACAWTFSAYISACTLEHPIDVVSSFVRELSRLNIDDLFLLNTMPVGVADRVPPTLSVGLSHPQYSPISPQLSYGSPTPFPPPPPQYIPYNTPVHSTSSGALSAFRQRAVAEKRHVTFKEMQSGPEHQCTWTEILLLDGVEVGSGSALSKQGARDIAARIAMQSLNWNW